jgi:hypothetical protein
MFAFLHRHDETLFDDPIVDASFRSFFLGCSDLADWMTNEGDEVSDAVRASTSEVTVYRLRAAHCRTGGQDEWEAARAEGNRLARIVIHQRRDFERVGRVRGL